MLFSLHYKPNIIIKGSGSLLRTLGCGNALNISSDSLRDYNSSIYASKNEALIVLDSILYRLLGTFARSASSLRGSGRRFLYYETY